MGFLPSKPVAASLVACLATLSTLAAAARPVAETAAAGLDLFSDSQPWIELNEVGEDYCRHSEQVMKA